MTDAYYGEIRIFSFTYAPQQWAFCDGAALSVAQNQILYAVIGNIYGGNPQSTLMLPNLQGRISLHYGASTGPGLSSYYLGEKTGIETVTLTENQMPAHNHTATPMTTKTLPDLVASPSDTNTFSRMYTNGHFASGYLDTDNNPTQAMYPDTLSNVGGSQAHNNVQPYLAMNFCICIDGEWPQRP